MILLITGCIQVKKEVPYVALSDTKQRIDAYMTTIKWAIEDSPFSEVVFCDNSNYEDVFSGYVSEINGNGKQFEYLTFSGNTEATVRQGKGYGEGEIIDYALSNSSILKNATSFYKITGKLSVLNIDSIVTDDDESAFYSWELDRGYNTNFYKVNKNDYDRFFRKLYLEVDDGFGRYLEVLFYDVIRCNRLKVCNLREYPLICGLSGTNGSENVPIEEAFRAHRNFFMRHHLYNNYFIQVIIKICDRVVRVKGKMK